MCPQGIDWFRAPQKCVLVGLGQMLCFCLHLSYSAGSIVPAVYLLPVCAVQTSYLKWNLTYSACFGSKSGFRSIQIQYSSQRASFKWISFAFISEEAILVPAFVHSEIKCKCFVTYREGPVCVPARVCSHESLGFC